MKVFLSWRATYPPYVVSWEHSLPDNRNHGKTECLIKHASGEVLWTGAALCSKGDQFSKEKGRKVSLARALRTAKFTRVDRLEFWNTYFGRKGVKHGN